MASTCQGNPALLAELQQNKKNDMSDRQSGQVSLHEKSWGDLVCRTPAILSRFADRRIQVIRKVIRKFLYCSFSVSADVVSGHSLACARWPA